MRLMTPAPLTFGKVADDTGFLLSKKRRVELLKLLSDNGINRQTGIISSGTLDGVVELSVLNEGIKTRVIALIQTQTPQRPNSPLQYKDCLVDIQVAPPKP